MKSRLEKKPRGQPVLPLRGTVLFPGMVMPLAVGRPHSVAAVDAAMATEDKTIMILTQRRPDIEVPAFEDLYTFGTRAIIKKANRTDDSLNLLVQGIERVILLKLERKHEFLEGHFNPAPVGTESGPEVEALRRALIEQTGRVLRFGRANVRVNLEQLTAQASEPLQLSYLIASLINLDTQKEQNILEAATDLDAMRLLHSYVTQEIQVLELREQIASKAQTELSKQQREYMLRQQLRAIQEELGESAPEKTEIENLRRRIDEAKLPEGVRKEVDRELNRLEQLPPAAPDYQVIRSYLDLVLDLPWSRSTEDILDLEHARKILDEDHYDLEEVKNRILEHLAVLKLNPKAKAPILCLVGPPGVGKTSLGQSIARALGRKFERFSLGGLHDESELRGHRRTYVGAMPGGVIRAIRRAGYNNPLLMLDEIDKIGRDFRGDPAAALLEILDPAQNHSFRDNYLDQPFDLSRVFFLTTANTLDTIPGPLRDRMEVLRLSGYTEEEKRNIARRYLIPRRLSEAGLHEENLIIPDETLIKLISSYTREAGVRDLERQIGRLASKVALRFAKGKTEPVTIQPERLSEMLGPERFSFESARAELPAGVVAGLAWTPVGGEILYIEANLMPKSKDLRMTGQLGDVMRESAQAAQTYLWSNAKRLGLDPKQFQETGVHVHVPAGAIPKDGPSAGVAMVSAMASAFSGVPCRKDTAMTGEITLSGLVLPVGGIKEKILAARRSGMRRVLLPKANEQDLREVSEEARKDLVLCFVERIDEVLKEVLPDLGKRAKPLRAAS